MPHCDACDRFYNPNTLQVDGTCPTCGSPVAAPRSEAAAPAAPWHFKVLLGATVLYLGWRLVEGVVWLIERL